MANLSLFYSLESTIKFHLHIVSWKLQDIILWLSQNMNNLFEKSKVPTMTIQSLVVYICASFTLKFKIMIVIRTTMCTKWLSVTWKIFSDSQVKTNLMPFVIMFFWKLGKFPYNNQGDNYNLSSMKRQLCLLVRGWWILQLG